MRAGSVCIAAAIETISNQIHFIQEAEPIDVEFCSFD